MEERDKEVIRRMYVRLERNLEAAKLIGYLYQEHVLNEEDMDKIRTKRTAKKKAEKLLKTLKKRKNGLKMLIKALLVTEIQSFLGHELLERVTWSEQELENFHLELEGKVEPCQLLQANLAVLKQKNNELISKLSEYEVMINVLKEENLAVKDVMAGSHQLFQRLWRSKRHRKADIITTHMLNEQTKADQGCQTSTSALTEDLHDDIIHDDPGIILAADAGRRWSDSVYGTRQRLSSRMNRRRSFNDSISRSSTSLRNAILGVFSRRHGIVEQKTDDDDCSDTYSHSTDFTILT